MNKIVVSRLVLAACVLGVIWALYMENGPRPCDISGSQITYSFNHGWECNVDFGGVDVEVPQN